MPRLFEYALFSRRRPNDLDHVCSSCFRLDVRIQLSPFDVAQKFKAPPIVASVDGAAAVRHDDVKHPFTGKQKPVRRGPATEPKPALASEGRQPITRPRLASSVQPCQACPHRDDSGQYQVQLRHDLPQHRHTGASHVGVTSGEHKPGKSFCPLSTYDLLKRIISSVGGCCWGPHIMTMCNSRSLFFILGSLFSVVNV